MRKLNNKGTWCDMCEAYGHGPTKCPNLDRNLDLVALVLSTNSAGDEWLDDSGSLIVSKLVEDMGSLINLTYLSVRALEASKQLGTNGLPHKRDTRTLYKSIRAKKKQHNYKVAGEKRRGKARTRVSKCGYCQTPGHTRRTCTIMADDKTLVISANKLYRKQFAARMNSLSLGAGSLLKFTLNNEGIAGRTHGWYSDYPTSFLSIVPELAFRDCTVFNMVSNYEYTHRAVIKHHPVGPSSVNHRLQEPLPIVSNERFFNKAFTSNEVAGQCSLAPETNHGMTAYDVMVLKPSKRQEFTEEWINDEAPWFMELFKKSNLYSYEWTSSFRQIKNWYKEAKLYDVS